MYPQVAIVILNYNTKSLLEILLPSVLASSYPNKRVVVADNASSDGSADWVKQNHPEIEVIAFDKNHGYAGGYNKALNQLNSQYFVLLNSDVEVEKTWIEPLVKLAESDHDIAAIQPKILDYYNRGSFEYAGACGGFIDKLGYPFCRGRIFDNLESDTGQYNANCEVFWVSGAALFIKAEDWKKIGGLDPDFFAHMEEIDLCWRLKNSGKVLMCCPESVIYHMGGGTLANTNARKTFLNFRNNLALLAKNNSATQLIKVIPARLVLDGLAGIKFISEGKFTHCWAIIKAHFNFYFHLRLWFGKRTGNIISLKKIKGTYNKSLVWDYFFKKKKRFNELEF